MLTDAGEPESYEEAHSVPESQKWLKSMKEVVGSLDENDTFDLVDKPKNQKILKNKWVYRIKTEDGNSQPRYKACLVVKGYEQRKGVDFDEIFSPVVRFPSIRVYLERAASLDLEIEQLDVKKAFLHGELEEDVYMAQPEGFEVKGKEHMVCKLKKSLYGLKQAPRRWYKKFESFIKEHGYKRTTSDHCVFIQKFVDGDFLILLIYVDDMLIVGKDKKKIDRLKLDLSKSFAMKDLGAAKRILGMEITCDRKARKLWLSQESYIGKVLQWTRLSR